MKIITQNYVYSKNKEKKCIRAAKKTLGPILGKKNIKKIKTLKIKMLARYRVESFLEMWDEKTGVATLSLSPVWMDGRNGGYEYGVMHELTHLRDIMNKTMVPEVPEKGEKLRVWYDVEGLGVLTLFNKVMPEWVSQELFSNPMYEYQSFLDHLAIFYPWEVDACLARRKYGKHLK